MPSLWSSVRIKTDWPIRSRMRPDVVSIESQVFMITLASPIASGALATSLRASSIAASWSSATGTTRVTSPMRRACSASMKVPAITSSLAQPGPIRLTSREQPPEPGIRLMLASVKPNRASSDAIRKSQDIASSSPPQAHTPWAAQITGISMRSSRSKKSCTQRYSTRNRSVGQSFSNQLTSAPAQNARSPSALITITRMPELASMRRVSHRNSARMSSLKAFRRSGRASVIVMIPSSSIATLSALKSWPSMMSFPSSITGCSSW